MNITLRVSDQLENQNENIYRFSILYHDSNLFYIEEKRNQVKIRLEFFLDGIPTAKEHVKVFEGDLQGIPPYEQARIFFDQKVKEMMSKGYRIIKDSLA